ncbi:hypothetical protein FKQ62_12915 [Vibrio sp. B1-2]|nr:hypothetical protein [Vibrio sp. B1-2]
MFTVCFLSSAVRCQPLSRALAYRMQAIQKATIAVAFIVNKTYFFEDLLGFKSGVFPGVFLLSRRR